MTGALLHRYCPDHTPERALCGVNVAGAAELAPEAVAADPRPACLVCEDLSPLACQDACLGARSEATS